MRVARPSTTRTVCTRPSSTIALIAALVNDAKTQIEAAKTAGKLSADQATQLESDLVAHITRFVDSTGPVGPGPRR